MSLYYQYLILNIVLGKEGVIPKLKISGETIDRVMDLQQLLFQLFGLHAFVLGFGIRYLSYTSYDTYLVSINY